MTNENQPSTLGIHHLGLTVKNVDRVSRFFVDILGFTQVGEKPEYPAVFVSDGTVMLTLWQAKGGEDAVAFDRKRNIGLHHVALKVANVKRLEELHRALAEHADVEIEFAPEALREVAVHMMFSIYGGLRFELIAPV